MSGAALLGYAGKDITAELRIIARSRGIASPTLDELKRVARECIRHAVAEWLPRQQLTDEQAVKVGALFAVWLGIARTHQGRAGMSRPRDEAAWETPL